MLELNHAEDTSLGKIRPNNEDAFGFHLNSNLFFVCDGMGGHNAGDFASSTVVATIQDILSYASPKHFDVLKSLVKNAYPVIPEHCLMPVIALCLANRRLFKLAVAYPELRGMGTTIVALVLHEGFAHTLHIGDSRAYLLRGKTLSQLTTDHSWVNELLEDDEITSDEAKRFKKKNVITRVVGTRPSAKLDLTAYPLSAGDLFMLCSDGLTGPVTDDHIREILLSKTTDIQAKVSHLLTAANQAGGPDNITVEIIHVTNAPVGAAAATPESSPVITLEDSSEAILKQEDKLLKTIFNNKPISIPKEAALPKKTIRERLPVYIIVSLLCLIFAIAALTAYKNIDRYLHPDKFSLVSTHNYDPASLSGTLEIVTDPSGAEVYVDGSSSPAGVTPFTVPFPITDVEGKNTHSIMVKKYGYQNITITKDIIPNDTITLTLPLTPESLIELFLGVDMSFPDGSIIFIASKNNPNTLSSLTVLDQLQFVSFPYGLPAGEYQLVIKMNNAVLWKYPFTARSGKRAKIYISSAPGHEQLFYEDL